MRVDVEILAANETDERDATLDGDVDRQAGRGRYGSDERNPRQKGLLDDFEGRAAADEEQMIRERQAIPHQHAANHFIDSVVPADVFRHRFEPAVLRKQAGRMQAARLVEYLLGSSETLRQLDERRGGDRPCRW